MAKFERPLYPIRSADIDTSVSLLPARLYKYVNSRHVADLLQRGAVRITTVRDCRQFEETRLLGDSYEGIQPIDQYVDHWDSESGISLPSHFRSAIRLQHGKITNASVTGTSDSGDRYLFCLSHRKSVDLMRRLGYDTCIEVTDVRRFFHMLNLSMEKRGQCIGLGYVYYFDPSEVQESIDLQELSPLQIKRCAYSFQAEVRIAWKPRAHAIAPFLLRVPELRSCLRRITI